MSNEIIIVSKLFPCIIYVLKHHFQIDLVIIYEPILKKLDESIKYLNDENIFDFLIKLNKFLQIYVGTNYLVNLTNHLFQKEDKHYLLIEFWLLKAVNIYKSFMIQKHDIPIFQSIMYIFVYQYCQKHEFNLALKTIIEILSFQKNKNVHDASLIKDLCLYLIRLCITACEIYLEMLKQQIDIQNSNKDVQICVALIVEIISKINTMLKPLSLDIYSIHQTNQLIVSCIYEWNILIASYQVEKQILEKIFSISYLSLDNQKDEYIQNLYQILYKQILINNQHIQIQPNQILFNQKPPKDVKDSYFYQILDDQIMQIYQTDKSNNHTFQVIIRNLNGIYQWNIEYATSLYNSSNEEFKSVQEIHNISFKQEDSNQNQLMHSSPISLYELIDQQISEESLYFSQSKKQNYQIFEQKSQSHNIQQEKQIENIFQFFISNFGISTDISINLQKIQKSQKIYDQINNLDTISNRQILKINAFNIVDLYNKDINQIIDQNSLSNHEFNIFLNSMGDHVTLDNGNQIFENSTFFFLIQIQKNNTPQLENNSTIILWINYQQDNVKFPNIIEYFKNKCSNLNFIIIRQLDNNVIQVEIIKLIENQLSDKLDELVQPFMLIQNNQLPLYLTTQIQNIYRKLQLETLFNSLNQRKNVINQILINKT